MAEVVGRDLRLEPVRGRASGTAMMPALLTRTSMLSVQASANARTELRSARFRRRMSVSPSMPTATRSPFTGSRTASTMRARLRPTRERFRCQGRSRHRSRRRCGRRGRAGPQTSSVQWSWPERHTTWCCAKEEGLSRDPRSVASSAGRGSAIRYGRPGAAARGAAPWPVCRCPDDDPSAAPRSSAGSPPSHLRELCQVTCRPTPRIAAVGRR